MMRYWFKICPHCQQGKLYVFRDMSLDTPYLHCEECEWGWRNPEASSATSTGFLTLNEEFDAEWATREFIEASGWGKYQFHAEPSQ